MNIVGTDYKIYKDRDKFDLYRVEPDNLSVNVAVSLESLTVAIQLAEIYERYILFHFKTPYSIDFLDDCLEPLRDMLKQFR